MILYDTISTNPVRYLVIMLGQKVELKKDQFQNAVSMLAH